MSLLDKLKEFEDVALYMSSGNDFYIIEELYNNKVKTDLIIMCEIYPENYNNLEKLFLNEHTNLSDNVVHNYKINILNNTNYFLELNINNDLVNKISKYNNQAKLLELEYIRDNIRIRQNVLFVVSENLSFSIKYLINNSISVQTIYIHGYLGSNITLDSIIYLFDKLKTKLYITNNVFLGYKEDRTAFNIFSELKTYNKKSLLELFKSDYKMTYFKVVSPIDYKYEILSIKNFTCLIDNKIFKIDLGVYNSKFSSDTYINGLLFKKNSSENMIGLDIILNTGIIVSKNYVEFKSDNRRGLKYEIINAYQDKYILIDDKFVRIRENIPADLKDILILDTFDIEEPFGININKGELVI